VASILHVRSFESLCDSTDGRVWVRVELATCLVESGRDYLVESELIGLYSLQCDSTLTVAFNETKNNRKDGKYDHG